MANGKAPFDQGAASWSLQGAEPQGCSVSSKPDGLQFGFHAWKIRYTDWNAGGSSNQGLSKQNLSGSNSGSSQKEAKRLKEEGKPTAAARELIGPRGGLPVLRQDLLRLATLLHVEIVEGDTIAKLKEKCRPGVVLLMTKTKHVKELEAKGKPSKSSSAFLSRAKGEISSALSHLDRRSQESRFQTMLSQVTQHVMNLQSNINPVLPVVEIPDDSMGSFEEVNQAEDLRRPMEMTGAADQQISDEEVQRLNAEYYAEMRQARTAMGGAAFTEGFD